MIHITDKRDCCGCAACVQRCPKHCIALREDSEGFFYPEVDVSACIGCGLCERVCPLIGEHEKSAPIDVLAVKNRNEEERMASSSGGVFVTLARYVIERGGVVFGAVFDGAWEVVHTYTETFDGVRPMMGSKYVQSRIGNSFNDAERFLKAGRLVLFTGSPCQIAGLRGFLRKDYDNLLAVDFLCHGVPSPGVWRKYLDETFGRSARRAAAGKNTVLSSSLKSLPVIAGIEFRDKEMFGWKKFSFVVCGESAVKADKNSVLLSAKHYENAYMRGFLADVYLRPSCYCCRCKNGVSRSDLTIADFWGIGSLMPDFDDDKGVGLVLVNSIKGKSVFDSLDMEVRSASLVDAKRFNGGFKEQVRVHPKRGEFFNLLKNGATVEDAVRKALAVSLCRRLLQKAKVAARTIKRMKKGNI